MTANSTRAAIPGGGCGPGSGGRTLDKSPGRFRIGLAAALVIFTLVGCVSLPSDSQLLVNRGSRTAAKPGADCGDGWQELPGGRGTLEVLDSAGFSLLSWNAYKGREARWPEDFRSLAAERDLVLLQEAHLTPSFRAALEASGLRWLMVRAFDYGGSETGVLTAATVSASAACVKRTAEPLIRIPKSALVTRYGLSGSADELWVINLHGVNFTMGTAGFGEQLRTLAQVIEAHRGPLILAGDFNDWNRAREETLRRFALKLGLSDLSFAEDRRSRHLGAAVDHVFYRGLEVLAADSVSVESSDHHPILARFRLSHQTRMRGRG